MKALPIVLFTTAICFVVLFSPQHHTMPHPGEKLVTSDTRPARPDDTRNQPMEGLVYRTLAYDMGLMTFRDSIATEHTVDGVVGTMDFEICDGEVPAIPCHQSIPAPTVDMKPMWTITFQERGSVVTELSSEAGSEG